MAQATYEEIWDFPVEKIYGVLVDYAAYPQFVPGVQGIEVLESNEKGARVKYSISIVKKLTYILKLVHERSRRIQWVLESGDLFKKNNGSWELESLGEAQTRVTYRIEIDIKGLIPKSFVKKLTDKNLPATMQAFRERVEGQ